MQCFWVNVVPDPFVDAAALLELTQSLDGNSITLEDEQAAVVSSGVFAMLGHHHLS